MKNCKVFKSGRKWIVVVEDGIIMYEGKTRASCFRWAYDNGYKVIEYQHGQHE